MIPGGWKGTCGYPLTVGVVLVQNESNGTYDVDNVIEEVYEEQLSWWDLKCC